MNKALNNKTGIGLRSCHYATILDHKPTVPWFEALADNYLSDPHQRDFLTSIRQDYPLTLHCVGMSLGSTDPLNKTYLQNLKMLVKQIGPTFISDHLSWSSVNNHHFHDLLPLPMTEEILQHLAERIQQVQEYLEQTILIENPSSYIKLKADTMHEWELLNKLSAITGCGILLDVNNIYVSAYNQKFDAKNYLKNINPKYVKQYHLAGYTDQGEYLFDQHSQPIHDSVWNLYTQTLKIIGPRPTLIERDDNIPPLEDLIREANYADKLAARVCNQHD